MIVVGVVAFAALIVLSRHPAGTQAILVCLTAAAVALTVARLIDAFWARPRLAPQVPRGAAGVVAGAMVGTLTAAVLGSYIVHLTPTSGAVIGLVTAAAAVLVDLSTRLRRGGPADGRRGADDVARPAPAGAARRVRPGSSGRLRDEHALPLKPRRHNGIAVSR